MSRGRRCRALGAVPLALAAGVSACDLPGACPLDIRHSVEVAVTDSATGAHLARGTRGAIRSLFREDSLRVEDEFDPDPLWLVAGQDGGTYSVRLERAGYHAWSRTGIEVEAGDCGPSPVMLEAKLQPAP
ncbi:MAG TPA: hypothetical protein VFT04_05225 [Gemmatimonadales bacterium]|nr:hypothetical protein [Gemmatimonadales bacterium]